MVNINSLERDGLRQAELCPRHTMMMNTKNNLIPDLSSDHDMVMMTFQVRLKKTRKPNQPRLRFDLEKLRDPDALFKQR